MVRPERIAKEICEGGDFMKKLTALVVIVVAAFVILNLTVSYEPEPDAVFPMTNQHIEWHYAGK